MGFRFSLGIHQNINGKKLEYYSTFKKERNPIFCDNTNEPRDHYSCWNKQNTERQTLQDRMYVWSLVESSSKQRTEDGFYRLAKGGD